MVKDVKATEPPALVDHILDLTAVPLLTPTWNVQTDPLSVIERYRYKQGTPDYER
jgi:hypothetical protein